MANEDLVTAVKSKSVFDYLNDWGTASLPPSLLATLITALHARPPSLPLFIFTPPLLFSSYLNLSGYPTGSAGLTAAWSGLYVLLALRRRQPFRGRFSVRGVDNKPSANKPHNAVSLRRDSQVISHISETKQIPAQHLLIVETAGHEVAMLQDKVRS
ncbi:uncharacterized protein LW93_11333 [Fusarium fujikuroi]|nr:uncharacterized protein LW93_11333 [Fusarium fujikuroi]